MTDDQTTKAPANDDRPPEFDRARIVGEFAWCWLFWPAPVEGE